jgi:hypothetical protein
MRFGERLCLPQTEALNGRVDIWGGPRRPLYETANRLVLTRPLLREFLRIERQTQQSDDDEHTHMWGRGAREEDKRPTEAPVI